MLLRYDQQGLDATTSRQVGMRPVRVGGGWHRLLRRSPRTVWRWIGGDTPVPGSVAAEVETLEDYTARAVGRVVDELRSARDPGLAIYDEADPEWSDLVESLQFERPVPARWWRMVVARAVHEVPGVQIRSVRDVRIDG